MALDNWRLKPGAPDELVEEFEKFTASGDIVDEVDSELFKPRAKYDKNKAL